MRKSNTPSLETEVTAALVLNGADATAPSHRISRDLAGLLALPAMWADHDPDGITAGLLGILFGMLRLESAYVRFDDPAGGPALERWRPEGPQAPAELEPVLSTAAARQRGAVTVTELHPSGGDTVRVTSMAPVFPGEDGLVVVSCRRPDFPTDLDLHLLRIAVGQATISIHTARRLASERAARLGAEAALRRRNEFLAALAQDLNQPLAVLAERAAQAHAFATEADYTPTPAGMAPLPTPVRLTRRETEVLGLLAQGLSNKEIAAILWLSERTIERHITSLYRKIKVQRRSEATAYAMRHGFVASDAREE